ncbi:MAG: response regulator transcription factor [Gammaproteobacteria bacterium]|nr:response regulator transcription factor [Gammaproteobacteria bacterium]
MNIQSDPTSISVLLIDDDVSLCEMLADYLNNEGLTVQHVHDGQSAIKAIADHNFDIAILDVMLPKLNGFEVLKNIRSKTNTPVLMLTARGEDVDRIVGLELGADDYLPKPFNSRELIARMRAVLRRTNTNNSGNKTTLKIGDITLNPNARTALKNDENIDLTGTEFSILQLLMANAGSIVTKKSLCEHVLGRKLTPYDRSLDTHISNLRKKLGNLADGGLRIKTIRGAGYVYINSA